MLNANIRIFKLWGIPVEINMSWILVLMFMTWTFATSYYPFYFPDTFQAAELWILGFVTAILLFLSILMHEFSHSLIASRNGMPIKKITLFMFGGVAQMERDVDSPVQELKTATAGPVMTVVLALLFFVFAGLFRSNAMVYALLRSLMRINIVVLVFNLIPGFPLDGGRILRAGIWYKSGNFVRATRIASRVGRGFAVVLIVIGFIYIFLGNFIGGLWMIFIGYFLHQAAQSGYMTAALKETLGHIRVSRIMRTNVVTVDGSTNLRILVDEYFLKYHYNSYPVLSGGKLVGIVSLKDVKQVDRDHWNDVTVENVMDKNVVKYALHPLDQADRLVDLIMRKGYGRLPVLDDDGVLVGIVTRRDLMEALKLITFLGE
jgi:Zn-dependent protease/predicted transcriptional regulator